MRRIIIACVATAALATWGGTAAASGPAPPGKEILELACAGDTFTISLPRGESSNGAAQLVGQKGHAIGVSFEFSVFDVTTDTLLFSESDARGGGHAHPNQTTRHCTVALFEGTAEDFFGLDPLPPGVAPTDIVRADLGVDAIFKL
jgi:hypothetical protein